MPSSRFSNTSSEGCEREREREGGRERGERVNEGRQPCKLQFVVLHVHN